MLVVSRKGMASIGIEPADGVDSSLTLREAFANGHILVKLMHVGIRRVRLVIEAPGPFKVTRLSSTNERQDMCTCAARQPTGVPPRTGKRTQA